MMDTTDTTGAKGATDTEGPTGERAHGRTRVPGEPALWGLLLGDLLVFLVLFVVYLTQRGDVADFLPSQKSLDADLAAVNTLLLLCSSLLVVRAVSSARTGGSKRAGALVLAAAACGVGFLVIKAVEYAQLVSDDHTPNVNDFYMYYFVLTGLHAAHLVLGLGLLCVLFWLVRLSSLSPGQTAMLEGGACFWHMVDLLWIVIFPLLFLVR